MFWIMNPSLRFNFYNSSSGILTTETISVNLYNTTTLYTNSTATGTLYYTGLELGTYTAQITSSKFQNTSIVAYQTNDSNTLSDCLSDMHI